MPRQSNMAHCPFCGSYNLEVSRQVRSVVCQNCGAEGPEGQTREDIIRRWNDRIGAHGARSVATTRCVID